MYTIVLNIIVIMMEGTLLIIELVYPSKHTTYVFPMRPIRWCTSFPAESRFKPSKASLWIYCLSIEQALSHPHSTNFYTLLHLTISLSISLSSSLDLYNLYALPFPWGQTSHSYNPFYHYSTHPLGYEYYTVIVNTHINKLSLGLLNWFDF